MYRPYRSTPTPFSATPPVRIPFRVPLLDNRANYIPVGSIQQLNAAHIQKPFQMRELLMQIKVNTWEMDASGESEVAS